jgi:hypothetical protein
MSDGAARRWVDAAEYLRVRTWTVDHPSTARVRIINSARDWVALVGEYPLDTTELHQALWGWEFSSSPKDPSVAALLRRGVPHAVRPSAGLRFLSPDWTRLAQDYDGVEVTWWAIVTAEGVVGEVDATSVAMLRVGGAARTIWLNPVLVPGEPGRELPDLEGFDSVKDVHAEERWLRQRISPGANGIA